MPPSVVYWEALLLFSSCIVMKFRLQNNWVKLMWCSMMYAERATSTHSWTKCIFVKWKWKLRVIHYTLHIWWGRHMAVWHWLLSNFSNYINKFVCDINWLMHWLTCIAVLLFLQPTIALFRPAPKTRYRYIFRWIHGLFGHGIHLLAG